MTLPTGGVARLDWSSERGSFFIQFLCPYYRTSVLVSTRDKTELKCPFS